MRVRLRARDLCVGIAFGLLFGMGSAFPALSRWADLAEQREKLSHRRR